MGVLFFGLVSFAGCFSRIEFGPGAADSGRLDDTDVREDTGETGDSGMPCDPVVWYADADGDGWGNSATSLEDCDQPTGYVADATDCDDTDASVHPDATEECDGLDDDCDGAVDEDVTTRVYRDRDDDGYGDPSTSLGVCDVPSGYTEVVGDCDDEVSAINPGAIEVCNGQDDDCDGATDEDAVDAATWYADVDSDGFGDLSAAETACDQPTGYVADATDCDDADAENYPGNAESCDGQDNDCDGEVGADEIDDDGDGDNECADADCDDTDASIYTGATESCDGLDNDCDGATDEDAVDAATWYADADGDGWGDAAATEVACDEPTGYVSDATDCDDADASVNPGATEACNGEDDDCDGSVPSNESDADADGYAECDLDCDDAEPTASPDGFEVAIVSAVIDDQCSDGLDNDCDGDADASDWDCQDDDSDGIGNGIDVLVAEDGNLDGDDDTLCVVAFEDDAMPSPWNAFDAVWQGESWGGFSVLNASSYPVSLTTWGDSDADGTDDVFAWCVDFADPAYAPSSSGAWHGRVVSAIAADGSSAAPASCSTASSSTTWQALDIANFCAATADEWCRTGVASTDGCGDSLSDGIIRIRYDSTASSIEPY